MTAFQEKAWGRTRCTICKDVFQEHELEVMAGGYCSIHYHENRANRFIVESGKIGVVVFRGWTWKRFILSAGDTMDIPSHVTHRFEVYSDGRVFEEYWPDRGANQISTADIQRIVVGDMLRVSPTVMEFDKIIEQHIQNEF